MTREELDKLEVGDVLWSMWSLEGQGEWDDPYPVIYLGHGIKTVDGESEVTVRVALKGSGHVAEFDGDVLYPSVAAALKGKLEALDDTILNLKTKRRKYEEMLTDEHARLEEERKRIAAYNG